MRFEFLCRIMGLRVNPESGVLAPVNIQDRQLYERNGLYFGRMSVPPYPLPAEGGPEQGLGAQDHLDPNVQTIDIHLEAGFIYCNFLSKINPDEQHTVIPKGGFKLRLNLLNADETMRAWDQLFTLFLHHPAITTFKVFIQQPTGNPHQRDRFLNNGQYTLYLIAQRAATKPDGSTFFYYLPNMDHVRDFINSATNILRESDIRPSARFEEYDTAINEYFSIRFDEEYEEAPVRIRLTPQQIIMGARPSPFEAIFGTALYDEISLETGIHAGYKPGDRQTPGSVECSRWFAARCRSQAIPQTLNYIPRLYTYMDVNTGLLFVHLYNGDEVAQRFPPEIREAYLTHRWTLLTSPNQFGNVAPGAPHASSLFVRRAVPLPGPVLELGPQIMDAIEEYERRWERVQHRQAPAAPAAMHPPAAPPVAPPVAPPAAPPVAPPAAPPVAPPGAPVVRDPTHTVRPLIDMIIAMLEDYRTSGGKNRGIISIQDHILFFITSLQRNPSPPAQLPGRYRAFLQDLRAEVLREIERNARPIAFGKQSYERRKGLLARILGTVNNALRNL